jgi:hypothetical protein
MATSTAKKEYQMDMEAMMEGISTGPHKYIIQFRGVTERDTITKEYEEMLVRLCKSNRHGI